MKYKTNRISYNIINEIIWILNAWSNHKHRSMRCIFAHQRKEYYIFYEIADNDFTDCL